MTRLASLWTLAIAVACSLPGSSIPTSPALPLSIDKWVHVLMFLGFGGLWTLAAPRRAWAVLAAGLAYAVGTEVWQGALPIGREPDPLDALADAAGLVAGVGLAAWWGRRAASNDPDGGVSG